MTLTRKLSSPLSVLTGSMLLMSLAACGGGGSSLFNNTIDPGGHPGPDSADFLVVSILPQSGQDWEVNRPIEILFNKPVNPASVTSASIAISQSGTGVPALGSYSLLNGGMKVVFQPTCPSSTDAGGLQAGGIQYVINIPSSSQPGATSIVAAGGGGLAVGKTSTFVTKPTGPGSFYDPKVNEAPQVDKAVFVTPDPNTGILTEFTFGSNAIVPTNKFVGPGVYFDLTFNQPVDPSSTNINSTNLALKFESSPGIFTAIPVSVSLLENCTAAGAKVRLQPLGLLPSGRKLRLVVGQGFSDITGETALFPTNVPSVSGTEPTVAAAASPDYDALMEEFATDAHEDPSPGFVLPSAEWSNTGYLQAGFTFGGQPTDNDLVVNGNAVVFIDTSAATLSLVNSLGVATTATFVNGNVFLRRLWIKGPGGRVVGQGLNPLKFFINETVVIEPGARLVCSGNDAVSVSTLLTAAAFPESGGSGQCGGGNGGFGNPVTSQSSVKGGAGFGPFGAPNGGGQGGSSALVPIINGVQCFENEDRHAAGGGGGSYTTLGEKGNDGLANIAYTIGSCIAPQGVSAVNPSDWPRGGNAGPVPFLNASQADNFIGKTVQLSSGCATSTTSQIKTVLPIFNNSDVNRYIALVRGSGTWEDTLAACTSTATAADPAQCFRSKVLVRQIQTVNDSQTVTIVGTSLMPVAPGTGDTCILMGRGTTTSGELITSLGGEGGGGGGNSIGSTTITNPNFGSVDQKGAGGGGGGGILQINALGKITIGGTIDASGGKGGAGENTIFLDRIGGGSGGGAGGTIIVQSADSIDCFSNSTSGIIFARGGGRGNGSNDVNTDPAPPTNSTGQGHGGRGGKGLVQLHAPVDPTTGLLKIKFLAGGTSQPVPANFDPAPYMMLAGFGPQSRVRSTWFDTGLPQSVSLPAYEFAGVAPPGSPLGPPGKVLTDVNGNVSQTVVVSNTVPSTSITANTIEIPKVNLVQAGNLKAQEPLTLLGDRINAGANSGTIIGAVVSGNNYRLTTDNTTATNVTPLNSGLSGNVTWGLVPRNFRVSTLTNVGELFDFLPPSSPAFAAVQMQFQGADADVSGNVNLNSIVPTSLQDPTGLGTSDLTTLVGKRFIRFTTTFDISLGATVVADSPRPRVYFIKVPFRFN